MATQQGQRFRQLIEVAPLSYVMHRDDRVLMVNRLVAASAGFDSPERMAGTGVYDFLAKPFDTASLLAAVARNGAAA